MAPKLNDSIPMGRAIVHAGQGSTERRVTSHGSWVMKDDPQSISDR